MADYLAGRLALAAERFGEAYQIAVQAGDRRSQAWSLQHLAWVTTTRGDFAGADAALGRAARLFAEQRDQFGRAWLRGTTAFTRLLAGRLAEARRLARAFLPFGERVGEAWAVGTLRAVAAFAAAELGELAEADREARRAYRDFAAADDDWGRGLALVVRGVVARGLGAAEHAADLLDDASGYGERTGHPLLISMARTMRGLVALEAGDRRRRPRGREAVLAVARAARHAGAGAGRAAGRCSPAPGWPTGHDGALAALAPVVAADACAVGAVLPPAGGGRVRRRRCSPPGGWRRRWSGRSARTAPGGGRPEPGGRRRGCWRGRWPRPATGRPRGPPPTRRYASAYATQQVSERAAADAVRAALD